MKYYYKLKECVVVFLLIGLVACSPKIVYQSSWQSSNVVADGIANEWKIPLRFYNPETKLNYTISNDNDNLYLCIRATDAQTQVKIMHAGIQLWIDTLGKNNKGTGLFFPIPNTDFNGGYKNNKSKSSPGDEDNSPSTAMHKSFLAQATEMRLTGFKKPIDGIIPVTNTYGIKVGMAWDTSDILIYEVIIPLKTFSSVSNLSTKNFSVGVFLNALPNAGNNSGEHSGDGSHGGGGGMGQSGGMGGGVCMGVAAMGGAEEAVVTRQDRQCMIPKVFG